MRFQRRLDAHLLAEHGGDGLACEVVLRRAQAAGREDDVAALPGALQRLARSREVVADLRHPEEVDAQRRQAGGDILRVRVDDLAQQYLRADGDYLRFHVALPPATREQPPRCVALQPRNDVVEVDLRAELEVAPQADAGQRLAVLGLAEAGEGVALVGLVEAAGGHGGVAEREFAGCAPCLLDRRLHERPGDECVFQAESVARFQAGADEGGVEAPRARFVEERRGGGGSV